MLAGALLNNLPVVVAALFVFLGSLGLVMPNGTALALDRHASRAGTAAALLGAPLVGLGGEGSALPMAVVLSAAAAASLLMLLTLARPARAR